MRYEIVGETLPSSDLYTRRRRNHDHRKKRHELDVTEYEDGDKYERRDWQSIWKDVFRRVDLSEHVYCEGRTWDDCFCVQLSGKDRCT